MSVHVLAFVKECVQLSWDMVIQSPSMVLNTSEEVYNVLHHQRWYMADRRSDTIIAYLWPTLVQAPTGLVLYKGIVIT